MVKRLLSKNVPVRFCEGQKEYFGKKVMSLHVDVFFYEKEPYFTNKYILLLYIIVTKALLIHYQ